MLNHENIECPIWVREEMAISSLLEILLDKIDRGVNPLVRITKKTVPELFDFTSDTHYIWSLIESLQNEYLIFEITLVRQELNNEAYENAKIRINTEKEDTVRVWLKRPKTQSDKELWADAVHKYQWDSEQEKQAMFSNPVFYPNKTSEEVIGALRACKLVMASHITLRALSAKCFWGDSKFLDNRLDVLTLIFPTRSANIKPRELLVNVHIPDIFSSVVFVENQDTFLLLVNYVTDTAIADNLSLNRTAFVYCAGFRGAASRIRDEGNPAFSFLSETTPDTRDRFTAWWLNKITLNISSFFWGDLDYSGLAILAALQCTFPGIKAWKRGYVPMVNYYHKGISHPKSVARKDNQRAPKACGCAYADTVLLPLIQKTECFLDQEVVSINDLYPKHFKL